MWSFWQYINVLIKYHSTDKCEIYVLFNNINLIFVILWRKVYFLYYKCYVKHIVYYLF